MMSAQEKPLTLADQITRTYALAMTVSLMIVLVLVFAYEISRFRYRFATDGAATSAIISRNIEDALAFNDVAAAQAFLSSLQYNPSIDVAAVFDSKGHLFAFHRRDGVTYDPLKEHSEYIGTNFDFLKLESHRQIFHSDATQALYLGRLLIKYNFNSVYDGIMQSIVLCMVVFVAAHLIGRIVINKRQKLVTGPILELTAMAQRISKAPEYGIRIDEKQRIDEIARLAASFNAMVTQIRQRDEQLELSNLLLEKMVSERTLELEEANRRLIQQFKELEQMQNEMIKIQKFESLGVLASGIAHNFNNVLTGVLGYISYAVKQLECQPAAQSALKHAENATKRAAEMARQLLTFARGGNPVMRPLSVSEIVQEAVLLSVTSSRFRVEVNIDNDLPPVMADESYLLQSINNILINAVQSMPDGGLISVVADTDILHTGNHYALPSGIYVRLQIKDAGCGIAPDDLKRVFDPYFTTKPEGQGLGLATVNAIMTKHGGTVSISSSIPNGTTVILLLPACTAEPPMARGVSRRLTGGRPLVLGLTGHDQNQENKL